jgi:hypothetical protein
MTYMPIANRKGFGHRRDQTFGLTGNPPTLRVI